MGSGSPPHKFNFPEVGGVGVGGGNKLWEDRAKAAFGRSDLPKNRLLTFRTLKIEFVGFGLILLIF